MSGTRRQLMSAQMGAPYGAETACTQGTSGAGDENRTRTVSLFGSIASHVVDDVANLLNALLRGIAGGQGEADVVAGLPIDVPIGRCDFDRSLMESEVHTGSRLQAGSLSKGLRDDQAPRGIDGCGDGREMPCGRGL